jgi:short-subunit dehydrogenase
MSESILILGANSAIAEATARCFCKDQASFVLVARNKQQLGLNKEDLLVRGAKKVATYTCDFSDFDSIHDLHKTLSVHFPFDRILIAYGQLSDEKKCAQQAHAIIENYNINLISPILLLRPIVEDLLAAPRDAHLPGAQIAVISSVAGDRGRASNLYYGSAKAGLSAFLSGLRAKLHGSGIHVLTIKPGFVDTPMTAHLPKNFLFASPTYVGEQIYVAMKKRRHILYTPSLWKWIMLAIKILPEKIFLKIRV